MGRFTRIADARWALVVLLVAIAGCAGVRQSVDGWLGKTSSSSPPQGDPYFSAVDGLPVYAEPAGSSTVVGHLALYERVVRTNQQSGYAYVTADRGGLAGWVNNAQLIWRLPQSNAATAPPAAGSAAPSPTAAAPSAPAAPLASPPANDADGDTTDAAYEDATDDAPAPTPVPTAPAVEATATPSPAPTSSASPTPHKAFETYDPF